MNNKNTGRPLPDKRVYAIDMIAVLSGVNYGSVVRILAAIETIKKGLDVGVADIVRLEDAPASPPFSYQGEDDHARIKATDMAVRGLFKDGANMEHFDKLKISQNLRLKVPQTTR